MNTIVHAEVRNNRFDDGGLGFEYSGAEWSITSSGCLSLQEKIAAEFFLCRRGIDRNFGLGVLKTRGTGGSAIVVPSAQPEHESIGGLHLQDFAWYQQRGIHRGSNCPDITPQHRDNATPARADSSRHPEIGPRSGQLKQLTLKARLWHNLSQ